MGGSRPVVVVREESDGATVDAWISALGEPPGIEWRVCSPDRLPSELPTADAVLAWDPDLSDLPVELLRSAVDEARRTPQRAKTLQDTETESLVDGGSKQLHGEDREIRVPGEHGVRGGQLARESVGRAHAPLDARRLPERGDPGIDRGTVVRLAHDDHRSRPSHPQRSSKRIVVAARVGIGPRSAVCPFDPPTGPGYAAEVQ
ncbi:MAG: hypothetical protein ACYSWX_15285, partial [Planctomycetota bacterium]